MLKELNASNKQEVAFSPLDRFFFVLTTSGFICGTVFTCLLYFFPFPILPSIFFGSSISSLVYRFMGGIRPEDSIQIGTVKLSGTLGSLIASIFALNYMFEQQIPPWSVLVNPNASNIIVLNNDGQPIKLDVEAKGIKTIQTFTIESANPKVINAFRKACWEGNGVCKDEVRKAVLVEDKTILQGEAKLCMNNANFLGLPLIVTNGDIKATRVEVRDLDSCNDGAKESLVVKISHEDATIILDGKNTGKGEISIAPLRNLVEPDKTLPTNIFRKN